MVTNNAGPDTQSGGESGTNPPARRRGPTNATSPLDTSLVGPPADQQSAIQRQIGIQLRALRQRSVGVQEQMQELLARPSLREIKFKVDFSIDSMLRFPSQSRPGAILGFGVEPNTEAIELRDEIKALGNEIVAIQRTEQDLMIRNALITSMPLFVVSNEITSIEQLNEKYGHHLSNPETRAVVEQQFNFAKEVNDLRKSREAQTRELLEDDNLERVLYSLGRDIRATAYGIWSSSIKPFNQMLEQLGAPGIAPGDTIEDVRRILSNTLIPEEVAAEWIEDGSKKADKLQDTLNALEARQIVREAEVLAGIENGELTKVLDKFQKEKFPLAINKGAVAGFLENPVLYLGLPLEFFIKNWAGPFGGMATQAFTDITSLADPLSQSIFGTKDVVPTASGINVGTNISGSFMRGESLLNIGISHSEFELASFKNSNFGQFFGLTDKHELDFELSFRKHKTAGVGGWQALGMAFEESETNWLGKLAMELVLDPTTYFGFGLIARLPKVPVLTRSLLGMERAWVRTADMPFIAMQKGFRKVLPQSPGQLADQHALADLNVVKAYLDTTLNDGVGMFDMGMVRIREDMKVAQDLLSKNWNTPGMVPDAARVLMQQSSMTRGKIAHLISEIGISGWDERQLDHAVDVIDGLVQRSNLLPGGGTVSFDEVRDAVYQVVTSPVGRDIDAAQIAGMGQRADDAIVNFLSAERNAARANFDRILSFPTNKDEFIQEVLVHSGKIYRENQVNPVINNLLSKNLLRQELRGLIESAGQTLDNVSFDINKLADDIEKIIVREGDLNDIVAEVNALLPSSTRAKSGRILEQDNAVRDFVTKMKSSSVSVRSRTAMMMASVHGITGPGQAARFAAGSAAAANRLSMAFTKMYLMSANYGPYNLVELQLKGSLMGMTGGIFGGDGVRYLNGWTPQMPLEELFMVADNFTPQLQTATQSVANSARLAARRDNPNNAFRRLYRKEQGGLRSIYGILDESLIKFSGRIGLSGAAKIKGNLTKRHLIENGATKEAAADLISILDRRSGMLNASMSDDAVRYYREEAFRRGLVAPDSLNNLSTTFTPGMVHAGKINELSSKYTLIDDVIQQHLIDSANDGTLFPKLANGQLEAEISESIWQRVMADPETAKLTLNRVRDEVLSHRPTDLDGLKHMVRITEDMDDFVTHIVARQMSATQVYTRDMKVIKNKDAAWENTWENIVKPILTRGEEDANAMAQHLKTIIDDGGLGLADDVGAQYHDLIDSIVKKASIHAKTRAQLQDYTRLMIAERNVIQGRLGPVANRGASETVEMQNWWVKYESGRDAIWRQADTELAETTAEIAGKAAEIDAKPIPPARSVTGRRMVMNDLALLWDSSLDALTAGMYLPELQMMRPKSDFINRNFRQAQRVAGNANTSANELGFTKEAIGELYDQHLSKMRIDPDIQNLSSPIFDEWNALRQELHQYAAGRDIVIDESDPTKILNTVDEFASAVESDMRASTNGRQVFEADWVAKRRKAFDAATDEFNINFPVYDNANYMNSILRFLMPFWTYEAHRINYVPRVMVRNPAVFHAWGRYTEESDRGYFRIPGTDIQVNFLRNSIFMGGFQRLVHRDFPEFYDQAPNVANVLDFAGKLGFFPNPYVSGYMASQFANKTGIWQVGEILPPPILTAAELLTIANPVTDKIPIIGEIVQALRELTLPSRFRDYRTSLIVSRDFDASGSLINFKRLNDDPNDPVTEEEQQIWDAAERKASRYNVLDAQVGLFRLRPRELERFRELSKQLIINALDITDEQYERSRELGYNLEEFHPFPPDLQEALRGLEGAEKWRGLATHLRESAVGQMQIAQSEHWRKLEEARTAFHIQELAIEEDYQTKGINQKEYFRQRREINQELANLVDLRNEEAKARGIPITWEERVAFATKNNLLAPLRHPVEEVLAEYFAFAPEDFTMISEQTGQKVIDWDGFFKWRFTWENALEGADRQEVINKITKWDTPLDRVKRRDYEESVRPYRALRDITAREFSEEEQALIKEFNEITDIDRRNEIRAETLEGGEKLIAEFDSRLADRRKRLRLLDPETDARLAFWGETTSLSSEKAEAIYDQMFIDYKVERPELALTDN